MSDDTKVPGLSKIFFDKPHRSALLEDKLTRTDGSTLSLPNCRVDSFQDFEKYGRDFATFYTTTILVIKQTTASIKEKLLRTLQPWNKSIEDAWKEVERLIAAQTEKAHELLVLYQDIQKKIPLPMIIGSELETDMLRLDTLHQELEELMTAAREAQEKVRDLITA